MQVQQQPMLLVRKQTNRSIAKQCKETKSPGSCIQICSIKGKTLLLLSDLVFEKIYAVKVRFHKIQLILQCANRMTLLDDCDVM